MQGWDLDVILHHLTLLLEAEEKDSLLGKRRSFQSRKHCRGNHLILSIMKEYFLHVNHIFSYTFCHFCCCFSLFSYLIVIFFKLFLPQPMILAICALQFSPSCCGGDGQGKKGEWEREQCGWKSLTVGTGVGSTIPKSQVMFKIRLGWMQSPFPLCVGMCAPVLWYTGSTHQPQDCVQPSDGSDYFQVIWIYPPIWWMLLLINYIGSSFC